jgi:hypothetical protein
MIKVKLAEYKDGKFKMFLNQSELSKEIFETGFDTYKADHESDNFLLVDHESDGFLLGKNFIKINCIADDELNGEVFLKDKKDPLNRFNGLFDGRTYGKGRFVLSRYAELLETYKDDFIGTYEDDFIFYDDGSPEHKTVIELVEWDYEDHCFKNGEDGSYCEACGYLSWHQGLKIAGNIHENPELYEKRKK